MTTTIPFAHRTPTPVLLPWTRLTNAERHRETVRHVKRHHGLAMTLNLKPEFEDHLRNNENPMRVVGKRMNAELNRLDLWQLPVLLVLEATRPAGRLHLHGVYLDNGYSRLRIQEAMRRAVGYVTGRSGARQFKSKLVYEANGWINYLHKDIRSTRRLLDLASDDQLWWISHAMTGFVRDEYEAVRLGRVATANLNTSQLSVS